MDPGELRNLLNKYDAGTCTQEELVKLYCYFDSFQDEYDVWDTFGDQNKESVKAEIFNRVNRRIEENSKSKPKAFIYYRGIAAGFLLLLFASLYLMMPAEQLPEPQSITQTTQNGQKSSFYLPDGTKVYLNSGSKITYLSDFRRNRSLSLIGEAFFEVVHDPEHPFQVESGALTTTVLGTTFNVSAYQEQADIIVSVSSGSVKVATENETELINPGQEAIYHNSGSRLKLQSVNPKQSSAWKNGVIIINGQDLDQVFLLLERWYGVDLQWNLPENSHCDLKLTFDNLALVQVLDQLKMITDIDYEIFNQKTIRINGTGCANENMPM
jgi:ferric-dicitrate binding protein FerR (iron transport regulator)